MSLIEQIKQPRSLIDDVEALLESKERLQDGLQHLSYSNGLMTAVIVGPEVVRPSEWMHRIIDMSGSQGSAAEAQMVMNLMLYEYNKVLASLVTAEEVYEPFFWEDEDGRQMSSDWADGFWTGVHMRYKAWQPILSDEKARTAIVPLVLCRDDLDFQSVIEETGVDAQETFDAAHEFLPDSVQFVFDYWQDRRSDRGRVMYGTSKKIGRNQPCPCGSGQKYKKCCLN